MKNESLVTEERSPRFIQAFLLMAGNCLPIIGDGLSRRPARQTVVDFALASAMLSPFLLTPDKSSITICLVDCRGGI